MMIKAPRIIVSERPAMLVYIDGDARYAPVPGTTLNGLRNTRVLLLKDPAGSYLLASLRRMGECLFAGRTMENRDRPTRGARHRTDCSRKRSR